MSRPDTNARVQEKFEPGVPDGQALGGGGWAMLYNSAYREDGTTTAFWQIDCAARLGRRGTAAPEENYAALQLLLELQPRR